MSCRYQLWLQYNTSKFWLAPRSSIFVEEESDFETINSDASCNCGDITSRDWHFGIKFKGGCDLAGAFSLNSQLQTFLDQACVDLVDLILYRQVCEEPILQYRVEKPRIHMVETVTQFTREHILSMDLIVGLTQWPPPDSGEVVIG